MPDASATAVTARRGMIVVTLVFIGSPHKSPHSRDSSPIVVHFAGKYKRHEVPAFTSPQQLPPQWVHRVQPRFAHHQGVKVRFAVLDVLPSVAVIVRVAVDVTA